MSQIQANLTWNFIKIFLALSICRWDFVSSKARSATFGTDQGDCNIPEKEISKLV